jgi:hypothetical protein
MADKNQDFGPYGKFISANGHTLRHMLVIAIVTSIVPAFAQSNKEKLGADQGATAQSRVTAPSKIHAQVQGFLRFEAMQYPTPVPENPQLSQSLLASTNLRGNVSGENNMTGFDFSGGKYVNVDSSQFQVNELYQSLQWRDGKSQISLGRKIEFWSQLDQDWQLGMWQPKSMLDSLRPEDQGLTGAFYRHQQGRFELLAFASPIFIPTLGPDIREKNGSLVADSRWYRPPSSSFPLNKKNIQVKFALDIPPMDKLIKNPGSGLRLKYGGETDGLWTSANYAYKPMNSLLLKYKRGLFLPEYDAQTGEVTIAPDVGYHHVYGADLGYRLREGMVSVSYLADSPQLKTAEAPYVLQQPRPMKSYAVHGETFVESSWLTSPVGLSLNYLRVDGGDIRDYDSYGDDSGAIFDSRYNYTNAGSLRADFSTILGHRKIMSSIKYLREFDQKGTLINSEFTYYPQTSIALILGADIIGVDDSSETNKDGRFLNQFRANDRFYGGMSYVF